MTGKCYVCKKPITFTDFEVGHNKPFSKGGTWNLNNTHSSHRTVASSTYRAKIETFKRKYFSKRRAVKRKTKKKVSYYIEAGWKFFGLAQLHGFEALDNDTF